VFVLSHVLAIVEHVRNGSTLRLYLVDTSDDIEVSLSGIRCPQMKTKESNQPEKFAMDAKYFTEHKLLHRNVTVTFDCIDKFNYYGTVMDEAGNNVVFGLLEFGLASVVEWNIPSTIDAKLYYAVCFILVFDLIFLVYSLCCCCFCLIDLDFLII
jgi:endonuclease YncB( thermonuclease family)